MHKAASAALPKASVTPITEAEHRLTLKEVLRLLLDDQLITREEAEQVHAERHSSKAVHPLSVIAERQFKNQLPPHKPLHIEALTEWLAGKLGL